MNSNEHFLKKLNFITDLAATCSIRGSPDSRQRNKTFTPSFLHFRVPSLVASNKRYQLFPYHLFLNNREKTHSIRRTLLHSYIHQSCFASFRLNLRVNTSEVKVTNHGTRLLSHDHISHRSARV